jgi:hypothetical protein
MLKTIAFGHDQRQSLLGYNHKKSVFLRLPQTKKQMDGFHYYGRNQQFFLCTNHTKKYSVMKKGLLNFYK